MRLSRSSLWVAVLVASGCAFEPGQPWGRAALDLEAQFAPPARALDEEGRLLLDDGALRLERVVIGIESVELEMSSLEGDVAFDPADPPPGYTLCHNGECHTEGGDIVPYEEVLVPAAGAAGATFVVEEELVELGPDPAEVELGECSNECMLDRGRLARLVVRVGELVVEGERFDESGTSQGPFEYEAHVDAEVAAPIEGTVDRGAPGGFVIESRMSLPHEAIVAATSGDLDAVRIALGEHVELDVEVENVDVDAVPEPEHLHD